jgi:hypothetical protein
MAQGASDGFYGSRSLGAARAFVSGVAIMEPVVRVPDESVDEELLPTQSVLEWYAGGCLRQVGEGVLGGAAAGAQIAKDLENPVDAVNPVKAALVTGKVKAAQDRSHSCFVFTHRGEVLVYDPVTHRVAPFGRGSGLAGLSTVQVIEYTADGRALFEVPRDGAKLGFDPDDLKDAHGRRERLPDTAGTGDSGSDEEADGSVGETPDDRQAAEPGEVEPAAAKGVWATVAGHPNEGPVAAGLDNEPSGDSEGPDAERVVDRLVGVVGVEDRVALCSALDALSEGDRRVLELRFGFVEKMAYMRMAGELERSDTGAKYMVERALARLRAQLGADAGGNPAAPEGPDFAGRALSTEDPKQFHDLWERLSQNERDWLYSQDHALGNRDGMRAVDRDHYNRLTLAEELAQARAAAAQVDALEALHPDWVRGKNIPNPNWPGAIFPDRLDYEAWQRQYDAARNGAKYLPDLEAVDQAVKDHPERKLLLLDTHTERQAHAAIADGDPDTATHVSVTTPGLGAILHETIGGMAEEAMQLRDEAEKQLDLAGHGNETVSTIAWIGCDMPQIPGRNDLRKSIAGYWDVSRDDLARAGAHDLARFYAGLGAAHQGVPAHLTAIGHSYGSLITGLALQEPGNHGVTDLLVYGSPGIKASTPQQLHLQPGHVYAMQVPKDPIRWAYSGPPLGHDVASGLPFRFNVVVKGILAVAEASAAGDFGPNPATNPNFTRLGTGAATVPDGHGGRLNLEGAHGHAGYPRWGSNGLPRTTGYNIAAVVAGLADHAIRGK